MKSREIIRLTISNIIFYLQKDEYALLSSFLDEARNYYHSLPNGQKLLNEFEVNVSSFLLEKIEGDNQIITDEMIEEVIENFGNFPPNDSDDINSIRKPIDYQNYKKKPLRPSISHQITTGKAFFGVLSVLGLSF